MLASTIVEATTVTTAGATWRMRWALSRVTTNPQNAAIVAATSSELGLIPAARYSTIGVNATAAMITGIRGSRNWARAVKPAA